MGDEIVKRESLGNPPLLPADTKDAIGSTILMNEGVMKNEHFDIDSESSGSRQNDSRHKTEASKPFQHMNLARQLARAQLEQVYSTPPVKTAVSSAPTALDDREDQNSPGHLYKAEGTAGNSRSADAVSASPKRASRKRPRDESDELQFKGDVGSARESPTSRNRSQKRKCSQKRALDVKQLRFEATVLRSELMQAKNELQHARNELEQAKTKIKDNEAIVASAQARLVSRLGNDMASGCPDDMIRFELQNFFTGSFLSWCSDVCVDEIAGQREVAEHMAKIGVYNESRAHENAPGHPKFDFAAGHGIASLALLQAALSNTLCKRYLTNPYFLTDYAPDSASCATIRGESYLTALEADFSKVRDDAAIDWRIKTVEMLEATMPLTKEAASKAAKRFLTKYRPLIKQDEDEDAERELVGLFLSFAQLALRLWKRRASIRVLFPSTFEYRSDVMEVEKAVVSASDQKLDGRPVDLLMRPLIVAQPTGGTSRKVVWLKAKAWISGDE